MKTAAIALLATLALGCGGGTAEPAADSRPQPPGVRIVRPGGPVLVPWGASQAQVKELAGGRCQSGEASWTNYCFPGGPPDFGPGVNAEVGLELYKEKLWAYHVTFDPSEDYQAIRGAMVGALGAPDASDEAPVQNMMGASFEQERLMWRLPDVDVKLDMRGQQVDEGVLSVFYRPYAPPSDNAGARAPF